MTNVYFAPIEVNDRDQSVFVAAAIEHNPVADFVGGGKSRPQFAATTEGGVPHDLEPTCERQLAIRVFSPELA
jgi:hypothetical protein